MYIQEFILVRLFSECSFEFLFRGKLDQLHRWLFLLPLSDQVLL